MVKALRLVALIATVVATSLNGATSRVLFPENLHLTREVDDPLSGSTMTIEEYCSGNRVVSVTADRTVVVDYEKQQITSIDRKAGTFSVSRFDEVAASAMRDTAAVTQSNLDSGGGGRSRWRVTPLAAGEAASGRSVETFEFAGDDTRAGRRVRVKIDRSISLTREAVEVLIGAAFPNPAMGEHEPILSAAREPAGGARVTTNGDEAIGRAAVKYGLPVTQSFTWRDSDREVTFSTSIVRIGSEEIPSEMLLIPPGARRIESSAADAGRRLQDLDRLPAFPAQGQ